MAKSIAIWLKNEAKDQNSNEKCQLELHFNYWSLNKKFIRKRTKSKSLFIRHINRFGSWLKRKCFSRDAVNFLDVGIKFSDIGNNDINIYFPFFLQNRDYDELGKHISSDVTLLSVIFNDEVEQMNFEGKNLNYTDIILKKENSHTLRFHTNLELEENQNIDILKKVKLNQCEGGSILTFPNDLITKKENSKETKNKVIDGYIRFRIILDKQNQQILSTFIKPKDRFFIIRSDHVEVVDFRINEARNLPDTINGFLPTQGVFKQVHFFIIRDIESEYLMANTDYKRCRFLEKELWKKYLCCSKIQEIPNIPDMIIYHWSSDTQKSPQQKFDKFSSFSKFRKTEFSLKRFGGTLFLAILFTTFINIISNYIYKFIN